MKTILVASLIILFTQYLVQAQCNEQNFKALQTALPGTSILKNYIVESKARPGIPFTKEYTYVLTRDRNYVFRTQASDKIKFSLRNNNNEALDHLLKKSTIAGEEVLSISIEQTGVYTLLFYAEESSAICMALQLAVENNPQRNDCLKQVTKQMKKAPNKGWEVLKFYALAPSDRLEYSYVFSKGNTYQVYLDNTTTSTQDLPRFTLLNSNKDRLEVSIDPQAENPTTTFTFECTQTGIYYLQFTQNKQCSAARLSYKTIK